MLTLTLYGVGVLAACLLAFGVNQIPSLKGASKVVRSLIAGGALIIGLVGSALVQQRLDASGKTQRVAEIRFPNDGQVIDRPQLVDVVVTGDLPGGHSLWLGYQNEKGGPLTVQKSMCKLAQGEADCGHLYVGHDERDTSVFSIFLIDADAHATSILRSLGSVGRQDDGENMAVESLPPGGVSFGAKSHITLRAP
jgi:hypothetical protein